MNFHSFTQLFADVDINVSLGQPPNYVLLPGDSNSSDSKDKNILAYNVYTLGINTKFQPFNQLDDYLRSSTRFDAYTMASNTLEAFVVTAPLFVQLQVSPNFFVLDFMYPQYTQDPAYQPFPTVQFTKDLISPQIQLNSCLLNVPSFFFPCIQQYTDTVDGTTTNNYNQLVCYNVVDPKQLYFWTVVTQNNEYITLLSPTTDPESIKFVPLPLSPSSSSSVYLSDAKDKLLFVFIVLRQGSTSPRNFFIYNPQIGSIPPPLFTKLMNTVTTDPVAPIKVDNDTNYYLGLLYFLQKDNSIAPTSCIFGYRNNLDSKNATLVCPQPPQSYHPSNPKTTDCSSFNLTQQECKYCDS